MEHELKLWLLYWEDLANGKKNFEVRKNDRNYKKGDILVLRAWDNELKCYDTERYKSIRKRVSYLLNGGQFGVEAGYVVMGLADE